jgi:hypothetical protein
MARRVLPFAVIAGLLAILPGCGFFGFQQRPAWRDAAEKACLARKGVRASPWIQPAREISGPGICGLVQPYKIAGLTGGAVQLNSPATLGCPVTEALEAWLESVVQPAALARFGQPVTQIESMGSYACRGINNQRGSKLSEHAFGNALDIGAFELADGRKIVIRKDWARGEEQEKAFLREAHVGACDHFTTVLGPGSNAFHYDHFHVDLAMHGATSQGLRRYCRPVIKEIAPAPRRDDLPDPPALEPEWEIARAKMRGGRTLAQAAPIPPSRPLGLIGAAPPPPARQLTVAGLAGAYTGGQSGASGGQARSAGFGGGNLALGAPPQPLRAPVARGMLRDDGAFVPPGEIGD